MTQDCIPTAQAAEAEDRKFKAILRHSEIKTSLSNLARLCSKKKKKLKKKRGGGVLTVHSPQLRIINKKKSLGFESE